MKKIIHKMICWYLKDCGYAFHHMPYGPKGRYVVMMSDDEYHRFKNLVVMTDA